MMLAEDTLPQFQIALADKEGQMWVCYKIESGVFQDYIFMLSDLDSDDHFNWCYGMLEKSQGKEITTLDPTEQSGRLAIDLAHYFHMHRQEILDKHIAPLYNRK